MIAPAAARGRPRGLINTLMIQDVLAGQEWADVLGEAGRRGLTPLFTGLILLVVTERPVAIAG